VGVTYLVDDRCTACGACLLTCPAHAFVATVPLVVDAGRCTDCGECVEVCPADAITRAPTPSLATPSRATPFRATPFRATPSPADHGEVVRTVSVATGPQFHDRHETGERPGRGGWVA
jgi:formate hydrogenlyase subunit 6/NADH:ubiquinone oxidoreductase subunit I